LFAAATRRDTAGAGSSQLGITDSSIRFQAKTGGVVEKAVGVDKEAGSATSALAAGMRAVPVFERQTVRAEQFSLRAVKGLA
jgi:hypothetical protein